MRSQAATHCLRPLCKVIPIEFFHFMQVGWDFLLAKIDCFVVLHKL
nr:MAG TPA: hypothetical protein [Caudoviricetes sp.]DAX82579.1 MAG TPA: hypothetical protein [Caudoviricetes sp.]